MKNITKVILFIILSCIAFNINAQGRKLRTPGFRPRPIGITTDSGKTILKFDTTSTKPSMALDSASIANRPRQMHEDFSLDSVLMLLREKLASPDFYKIEIDSTLKTDTLPPYFFRPVVFCDYNPEFSPDSIPSKSLKENEKNKYYNWLRREVELNKRMERIKLYYIIHNPDKVKYNIKTLPRAPKHFQSKIDPREYKIELNDNHIDPKNQNEITGAKIKKKNWLHNFNGSVQFSQAYISPNWYQGGNDNLNMLLNTGFSVKLNEAFHPNLLFETSINYKLGMNSAPDDTLRNYSISEDLLQINSKFGIRAAKRWFYSIQTQFKTQIFNSYKSNTNDLKASFLSPGELNVGVGMTYNYANKKKTFTFDASASPLSYNLKTCTNERMDVTAFDIKPRHKTASQIGSSGEGKLKWQIAHNILLTSRLFIFSDYEYIQGDLENTLSFAINRFLSTQINVHLRYDSSSMSYADTKWHKFQMKEILSFGFAYNIKNL